MVNENVALVLELVDFNPLSANEPKFADSIIYSDFLQKAIAAEPSIAPGNEFSATTSTES